MLRFVSLCFGTVVRLFRARRSLLIENLALRQQLAAIKERAQGEWPSWYLVDSLAAYANVLHKIGREPEAAEFDKRVEAIRAACLISDGNG
jgi:hypothetical protein